MCFPIAAVEICNSNDGNGFRLETADIDADTVGVGARNVKGFDAAVGAETVLGDTGVEGVGGEVLFPLEEAEPVGRHDQVEVGGHRTDRAIAESYLELSGSINLEANATAVAPTTVGHDVLFVCHGGQFSSVGI